MEDVAASVRLGRALGGPAALLSHRVRSSARRYEALGGCLTSALNAALLAAYALGAPPSALRAAYAAARRLGG